MTEEETKSRRIRWSFIILTLIFCVILGGFAWIVNDLQNLSKDNVRLLKVNNTLIQENNKRISEIQQSRIESCKLTYQAFGKVFEPFYPRPPRTPEQQAQIDKFNGIIASFLRGCEAQVKP